jgi:ATP-binding cassette subfamily B protein
MPFRRQIFEVLAATVVLLLAGLALPFFTQAIVDRVLVYEDHDLLRVILVGMIAVLGIEIALGYFRGLIIAQIQAEFERDYFGRFFEHFLYLRQSFFDRHLRQDLVQRFEEIHRLRQVISPETIESALSVLLIIVYGGVLFLYNVLLGATAVLFVALYAGVTALFVPRLRHLQDRAFDARKVSLGGFLDALDGQETVRSLGIEKLKLRNWKGKLIRTLNRVLDASKLEIVLSTAHSAMGSSGQMAIYWGGAFLAVNQELSVGEYIAFTAIFLRMMGSVQSVASLSGLWARLSVAIDRVNDVLLEPRERRDVGLLMGAWEPGDVEFRGVSFAYESEPETPVLVKIDLTIRSGEKIGVVGRNGSGKTTLVKLLHGFYDSFDGEILVGGRSILQIHPARLREEIFLLSQTFHLFEGTIRENIAYGRPEATLEEVTWAAEQADALGFVNGLLFGLNHKLVPKGANISSGQRLKIAFARLFLARPRIIVLDEASSALDVETEERILANLHRSFPEATVISIAHRLNTLKDSDRIVVLDQGANEKGCTIVESGTHKQLMNYGGVYSSFVRTYLAV